MSISNLISEAMTRGSISNLVLLACVVAFGGCETADDDRSSASSPPGVATRGHEEDLLAFWLVYTDHLHGHEQAPESWEAAIEFAKANEDIYDVGAIERLRDAGCEATWTADSADLTEGSEDVQIAHFPGGPKLMLSGAIVE
jgi:hypothetical protein